MKDIYRSYKRDMNISRLVLQLRLIKQLSKIGNCKNKVCNHFSVEQKEIE